MPDSLDLGALARAATPHFAPDDAKFAAHDVSHQRRPHPHSHREMSQLWVDRRVLSINALAKALVWVSLVRSLQAVAANLGDPDGHNSGNRPAVLFS